MSDCNHEAMQQPNRRLFIYIYLRPAHNICIFWNLPAAVATAAALAMELDAIRSLNDCCCCFLGGSFLVVASSSVTSAKSRER